jgi:hypothetical protein
MSEKPLTRTQQRILDGAYLIEVENPKALLFQHTVLCQVALPYRNPGSSVQTWDRRSGAVSLSIRSGRIMDPRTDQWRDAGIPYGVKARLILLFMNAEAIRNKSPVVELGKTFRRFLARLELDPNGRNTRGVKDQLLRLAAAQVSLAVAYSKNRSRQVQTQIVGGLDLWSEQDGDRSITWPTTVQLSTDYFAGLLEHGVPLDQRAIFNLRHNCRALDVYAWLPQRLCRVKQPVLIPWHDLQLQFGDGDPHSFRQAFRKALQLALSQYPKAQVTPEERGLRVFESPPPVMNQRQQLRLVQALEQGKRV